MQRKSPTPWTLPFIMRTAATVGSLDMAVKPEGIAGALGVRVSIWFGSSIASCCPRLIRLVTEMWQIASMPMQDAMISHSPKPIAATTPFSTVAMLVSVEYHVTSLYEALTGVTIAVNSVYSPDWVSTLSRLIAMPVGSVGIPHDILKLAPNGCFTISC